MKESVFTMKLEPELRAEFMAEAEEENRPASQIVREMMRNYIEQKKQSRDYDVWLKRKIDVARRSMYSEQGRSNDEIEKLFATKRDHLGKAENK